MVGCMGRLTSGFLTTAVFTVRFSQAIWVKQSRQKCFRSFDRKRSALKKISSFVSKPKAEPRRYHPRENNQLTFSEIFFSWKSEKKMWNAFFGDGSKLELVFLPRLSRWKHKHEKTQIWFRKWLSKNPEYFTSDCSMVLIVFNCRKIVDKEFYGIPENQADDVELNRVSWNVQFLTDCVMDASN